MKMKLFLTAIFTTLFLTVTCSDDKKDSEDLSRIVRHFSARIASYLIAPKYGSTDNFVFSGLRVVSTLLAMHELGSDNIRSEVETILGLTSSLIDNNCEVMNTLTKYEAIEDSKFGVLFNSTLFYRQNMEIIEANINGPCISGQVQSLDFTNKGLAQHTINDWYDVWREIYFQHYLSEALNETTNELLMNRLRMKIVMDNDFNIGDPIEFVNIKEKTVKVNSMEKIGMFAYKHSEEHKVYLIREDFPGDRFSFVVILPDYKDDIEGTLKSFFEVEVFSNVLLEVTSLTNKTRMLLRMPELEVQTRVDLKEILKDIGMHSIDQTDSLNQLTKQSSQILQFPHSEFIQFTAPDLEDQEYDGLFQFQLANPFIFVVLDKKFSVPLKVVVYTGLKKFSED